MEVADPIPAFTLTLSHCLALQVAKDVQVFGLSQPPTLLLAMAIVAAHMASHDVVLLALAVSGMLVLLLHGSQSNHVLLEAAVMLAVLLTAPIDVLKLPLHWPQQFVKVPLPASTARNGHALEQRRAWSLRLTLAMRGILIVLYACTGFAKLNDDWHDPHVSCCVQMFVGSVAGLVDMAHFPQQMVLKMLETEF